MMYCEVSCADVTTSSHPTRRASDGSPPAQRLELRGNGLSRPLRISRLEVVLRETHRGRNGASGRGHGSSQGVYEVGTDSGNWARDTDCGNWFAGRIQNWGTYAARALDSLFIVHGVALPTNLLEFLTELHKVSDGSWGSGLECNRIQNCFLRLPGKECHKGFAERSYVR